MLTEFYYGTRLVYALSNEIRIEIVRLVSEREYTFGELEAIFPVCSEILLQHIVILTDAKVLKTAEINSLTYYGIHPSSNSIVNNFLINKGKRGGLQAVAG